MRANNKATQRETNLTVDHIQFDSFQFANKEQVVFIKYACRKDNITDMNILVSPEHSRDVDEATRYKVKFVFLKLEQFHFWVNLKTEYK